MKKEIINKVLDKHNLDGIFSMSSQFRLWLTSFQSSAGFLFVDKSGAELVIDGRYFEQASKDIKNAKVTLQEKDVLVNLAKVKNYKRIGLEKEYVTLYDLEFAKFLFPEAEFVNINGAELRIIKTNEEIEKIRKAAQISLKSLEQLKEYIKPGVTEKELDARLEFFQKTNGGQERSFLSIVASGPNGSKPHGIASERKLQDGELITIDFGTIFEGYCSDITRTFHIGNVTDPKLLEIEAVLREAQKRGVEAVKPGITTQEVDKVCRDYITEKGYGKYFVHSTGHGLGIDVHELPNVSANPKFSRELEPGMIITVEPGIYIAGLGGIRVEDDVLVTENGHEVLSRLPNN